MSLYTNRTVGKDRYDAKMSELLGLSLIPRGSTLTSGLHFGMELEVENAAGLVLPEDFNRYWTLHEDNSLRNNGIEFVSIAPVSVNNLENALSILERVLQNNPNLSYSERTSFHVHINAQDMTYRHMHSFLTLYYLLENLLVARAGDANRVGNLFCLRACDANRLKRSVIETFSGKNFSDAFTQDRYSAMNFAAFSKYRTLELRFHRAVRDVGEYRRFLAALQEMYDYTKTLESPREIFENMSAMGYSNFLFRQLPRTYFYLGGRDFTNDLNETFMFAQSLAYCVSVVDAEPKKTKKTVSDYWVDEMNVPAPNRWGDLGAATLDLNTVIRGPRVT